MLRGSLGSTHHYSSSQRMSQRSKHETADRLIHFFFNSLGKCKTFKRGPLSRTYPNFCTLLEELEPIMERLNKRQLDDFSDDVIEKVIPKKKMI